ncbi:MAG: hypothetical protein QM759_17850 [Terricaulis sp.]
MPAIARMHTFERRPLTAAERALGQGVFAEEIAWSKIRVQQAPLLGFSAMVPLGRTIVFSRWKAPRDFGDVDAAEQGWFIHELTHCWQAARGVVLAGAKLGALGEGAYTYTPKQNAALKHYNIESQAEIVRHLFLARAGAASSDAPDRAWLEALWAQR